MHVMPVMFSNIDPNITYKDNPNNATQSYYKMFSCKQDIVFMGFHTWDIMCDWIHHPWVYCEIVTCWTQIWIWIYIFSGGKICRLSSRDHYHSSLKQLCILVGYFIAIKFLQNSAQLSWLDAAKFYFKPDHAEQMTINCFSGTDNKNVSAKEVDGSCRN